MVRNLIITKKPREDPIPDKPISFPPLENLHLELLENKSKLKSNLPPVKPQKRPSPPPPQHLKKDKTESDKDGREERGKDKKVENKKEKTEEKDEDSEMIEELGEEKAGVVEDEIFAESGEETGGDGGAEAEGAEDEGAEDEGAEDEGGEDDEDDPYAGLSPEEREIKEKEEYIWRFRILKKQYKSPQIEIPSFNEHSDLQMMKTTYDRTLKELYLDDAVETYRSYLTGGWILMEFVCTQWLGIDLGGFAHQQARMMYKYDRMLIELGEKSYGTWGMNLPVEVRLIGFILLQAGIFYLGKVISLKYGNNIADLFKGITGQPPDRHEEVSENSQSTNKKRMRGPRIKPEDIRNMNSNKSDEHVD